MPAQRIHLDICAVPSHDVRPMLLRNPYGVEMGTSGLIIRAESREEILADKLLAFALRPGRIKNRDLWDIVWLRQQGISLPHRLLPLKIADHHQTLDSFLLRLGERRAQLAAEPGLEREFQDEMRRFLPLEIIDASVSKPEFWTYLVSEIDAACTGAARALENLTARPGFRCEMGRVGPKTTSPRQRPEKCSVGLRPSHFPPSACNAPSTNHRISVAVP